MAPFTVVGSAPLRLVAGAAVTNPGATGALVGTCGTVGLDVGGPLTVATAAGFAGIAVCVGMSFLPASVGGTTLSRRVVG